MKEPWGVQNSSQAGSASLQETASRTFHSLGLLLKYTWWVVEQYWEILDTRRSSVNC